MIKKTFSVRIVKPTRTREMGGADIKYYVEAENAKEAFLKIDKYTGTYPCDVIEVALVDAKIYCKKS